MSVCLHCASCCKSFAALILRIHTSGIKSNMIHKQYVKKDGVFSVYQMSMPSRCKLHNFPCVLHPGTWCAVSVQHIHIDCASLNYSLAHGCACVSTFWVIFCGLRSRS